MPKDIDNKGKETQAITPEDAGKAKKKGGLFGDPVFTVSDEDNS